MLFSNACRFVLFSLVSLSANASTVRSAQRELDEGEDPVELGAAENYAILAQTGIDSVPASAITGDIWLRLDHGRWNEIDVHAGHWLCLRVELQRSK
jgi:hypothetical protein